MNTCKSNRAIRINDAIAGRRLAIAVSMASLCLFASQVQAQESVEDRLSALEQQLADVEPHARGEEGFSFNTYGRECAPSLCGVQQFDQFLRHFRGCVYLGRYIRRDFST